MGTLDQFASNFGEGQRVSQFYVSSSDTGLFGDAPFLVKSAQFPASTIGVIEVPFRGRKIKLPGDRVFNEWSLTAMLDKENKIYDAFVTWMDQLNSHSNVEAAAADDILRQDWTVWALAPSSSTPAAGGGGGGINPNSAIIMKNCFPTEVGTVDFNWETTDTIAEFTVTIHFDYWEKAGATT